jgi:nicotinate-nucleotide--dimethylbenzimidazole phosphoribosyltransferase
MISKDDRARESASRNRLEKTLSAVQPIDAESVSNARARLDRLTKPQGSLGRLEDIAARVCGIQRTVKPKTDQRLIIVCAADHGVCAEGVSAYPSTVTPQMVANFMAGGAAINALARATGIGLWVIDVGVDSSSDATDSMTDQTNAVRMLFRRVRRGTRNMVHEAAMSEVELLEALAVGIDAAELAASHGVTLVGLGDMGIGNTTAASAITAALLNKRAAEVTGRGTGLTDVALEHKVQVIDRALDRHQLRADEPFEILRALGGLEIAALCGVCFGAAAARLVVVVDGFITTAAALVAVALCPEVAHYLVAAHLSPEPGHALQLDYLRQRPLLNLDMRLGEGTGAALGMNVIVAACAAFNEMATFESAGVSGRHDPKDSRPDTQARSC